MLSHIYLNRGSKETLIILHGIIARKEQLQHFWNIKQSVLAIDLPGHGNSIHTPGKKLLEETRTRLQETLNHYDIKDYNLLGFSLGGFVTLDLLQHGFTPKKIVIISAAPTPPNASILKHYQVIERAKPMIEKHHDLITRLVDRYRALRHTNPYEITGDDDLEAALGFAEELCEQDYTPTLKNIHCAALIIHGTKDRIIPVSGGRTLAKHIHKAHYLELAEDHISILHNSIVRQEIKAFLH